MANTTNFGWETPDDTDLVKDGAAAIRTLGSAIDTSLVDLKGGTTGQVLAKASNTDMDFTWASDASGIPATIFDAKGDIIAASAADTAARLAVGANGTVLTADSSTATGLKWAAASGGLGTTWSLLNAGGTALTGNTTITVSGLNKDDYFIWIDQASSENASSEIRFRVNSDTGANYYGYGMDLSAQIWQDGLGYIQLGNIGNDQTYKLNGVLMISGGKSAVRTPFQWTTNYTGVPGKPITGNGFWNGSAAITSFSLISSTGNFDGGTLYIYGR
jgi:hypothetical protein